MSDAPGVKADIPISPFHVHTWLMTKFSIVKMPL